MSFANLDDEVCENIGRAVRAVARGYVVAFQASQDASAVSSGLTAGVQPGRR